MIKIEWTEKAPDINGLAQAVVDGMHKNLLEHRTALEAVCKMRYELIDALVELVQDGECYCEENRRGGKPICGHCCAVAVLKRNNRKHDAAGKWVVA